MTSSPAVLTIVDLPVVPLRADQMAALGSNVVFTNPGEDAGDEAQREVRRRDRLGTFAHVRQHLPKPCAEAVPMQESAEGDQAGMSADFLVGEADLDRLVGRVNLDEFGHGLVTGIRRRNGFFFHSPAILSKQ